MKDITGGSYVRHDVRASCSLSPTLLKMDLCAYGPGIQGNRGCAIHSQIHRGTALSPTLTVPHRLVRLFDILEYNSLS